MRDCAATPRLTGWMGRLSDASWVPSSLYTRSTFTLETWPTITSASVVVSEMNPVALMLGIPANPFKTLVRALL